MKFFLNKDKNTSFEEYVNRQTSSFIISIVLYLFAFICILCSYKIVPTSYVGIKSTLGIISQKPLDRGLHLKIPFFQTIELQSIKTIQEEHELKNIQAKDMQEISVQYKVAYRIPFDKVVNNKKTLKGDVYEVIIAPRVKETMADVIVRYTAEEVIAKREEISKIAKQQIMQNNEIANRCQIEEVVLIKFDFSDPAFKQAINDKKRAIQYAEQAEIEKKTAKAKAEQEIFLAEGRAKAIKLEAEAMKANQSIVQMKSIDAQNRAIDKWNGEMPDILIIGGEKNNNIPLINIPSKILNK